MDRKKIKSSRYFAALTFTLLVFIVGFYFGNYVNQLKLNQVNELQNQLRVDFLGNEILYQLISEENICDHISSDMYNDDLGETGQKLTHMEGLYGYDDERVISMKNYYSLLSIRHYLLQKKANDVCGFNKPQLLYFYTNYGCGDCEDQGLVLSNVNREYPVFDIYSFETNLDNDAIDLLEKRYNITSEKLPCVVIDDDVYYGFKSKDFLVEKMNLKNKLEQDKISNPEKYD